MPGKRAGSGVGTNGRSSATTRSIVSAARRSASGGAATLTVVSINSRTRAARRASSSSTLGLEGQRPAGTAADGQLDGGAERLGRLLHQDLHLVLLAHPEHRRRRLHALGVALAELQF